jgi:predicted unusual protein kinase regulating ubiquinone biosynthesis (AarF/ABC1/UbiB family)
VLEWIEGIKINDYATLEREGIDRLEVAKRTVQTYFYQFFEAGFFHADPHPGNIFVKKGSPGEGPIIEFVDFGMVGTLSKTMKKSLKDLFLSFVTRDSHALVEALARLGFIGDGANMAAIERGMALMLEQYYGMTLGEARGLDIPDVADDVGRLLYGQPFQIPAQFAFTGRAVSTLVGVSTGLAPDFNFVDVATPYARKFLGLDAEGVSQTIQDILKQLLDVGRVVLKLPGELERVINKLDMGQIEVKTDANIHAGRPRRNGNGNGRRGNGAAYTGASANMGIFTSFLTFVTSLGGGILLTNAHQMVAGWIFLGLAGLLGLRLLFRR